MRITTIIVCLCCLVACSTPSRQNKYNNPKQAEFDSIVQVYYKKHLDTFNDIVEKDLASEYKTKVDSFLMKQRLKIGNLYFKVWR